MQIVQIYCAYIINRCMRNNDILRIHLPLYEFGVPPRRGWLRSLYTRPDLIPYLNNNRPEMRSPAKRGSLFLSQGYRDKVIENDDLSDLDAPLIGAADGAPFFSHDKSAGAWFFLLRHAALPEELATQKDLSHLCIALPAWHQYEDTEAEGSVQRQNKKHPSVQCAMLLLVQELRKAYYEGLPCRNHSIPPSDPRADFMIRGILLLICGDSPGQADVCGMSHQGKVPCHFCKHPFPKILGTTGGCVSVNNRRNLHRDSPMRNDSTYGEDKADPKRNRPAERRTHAQVGPFIFCLRSRYNFQ